jgi:hypothetical protein
MTYYFFRNYFFFVYCLNYSRLILLFLKKGYMYLSRFMLQLQETDIESQWLEYGNILQNMEMMELSLIQRKFLYSNNYKPFYRHGRKFLCWWAAGREENWKQDAPRDLEYFVPGWKTFLLLLMMKIFLWLAYLVLVRLRQ